jgi:hypothetical protein
MTDRANNLEEFLTQLQAATMDPAFFNFDGPRQSLSRGTVGLALFHIERAASGYGDWETAHAWIKAATAEPVSATAEAGLFAGAGAITLLLHCAETAKPGRYEGYLRELGRLVVRNVHIRADAAINRRQAGVAATFAEYDVFTGLGGLGRLILKIDPGSSAMERILEYLVGLATTVDVEGAERPGWWVAHDPDPLLPTPGGHANLGLAHGISGPLALLALARLQGTEVEGQEEAITTILAYLDQHAVNDEHGTWWPQWVTENSHHHAPGHPPRPSWCYGTPGIARAIQLAALAIDDRTIKLQAENAIASAVSKPEFMEQLVAPGLCHGWAGTSLVVAQAARQASGDRLSRLLPGFVELLGTGIDLRDSDMSLLEGIAGVGLTTHTLLHNRPSAIEWEACLLTT